MPLAYLLETYIDFQFIMRGLSNLRVKKFIYEEII